MLMIEPFDFSDAHYAHMYTVDLAAFPQQPMSSEQWRHIDQTRDPKFPFFRDLIWRQGRVVAYGDYGQLPWAYHPQKYSIHVFVHPQHDTPDIRPAYFAYVLDKLANKNLIAIQTGVFSHWDEHMDYVHANGFHEVIREQSSELDLTTFDPGALQPLLDRVAAEGIRIITLNTFRESNPDWQRALYNLEWAVSEDIPSAGNKQRPSFEEWCASRIDGPFCDPEGWFVALEGEQVIGLSEGTLNSEDPTLFNNSLTGVLRSHRRRGIATALKAHLLRYAQSTGAQRIQTFNEEKNPMYQLNLKLGFQPQPAWITFEKELIATHAEEKD